MAETQPRIGILVADSGAFIKAAPLHRWSERVLTVKDVVAEIKDEHTRRRMGVLPYSLDFREPSQDAIHRVTSFAKKTGDYQSLSAVDLRVMALAYQLECEEGPTRGGQLRTEPANTQLAERRHKIPGVVGFHGTQGRKANSSSENESAEKPNNLLAGGDAQRLEKQEVEWTEDSGMEWSTDRTLEHNGGEEQNEDRSEQDPEEDLDDEEGWITPENFQQACEEMGGALEVEPQGVAVGCVTTDFAMQNVMLQMGLIVISVEGMRIKQLRTYAMKCKGCFRTTTNASETFCPSCGNRTLYKVSVVVDEGGKSEYRPLSKKQFSRKGLRYSLPLPKGGRHANNPVLAPDQRVTYRERRKRSDKVDPLAPDYVARTSPFAMNDVTSRGAQLAFARGGGGRRRNPNAVRPKGRRK